MFTWQCPPPLVRKHRGGSVAQLALPREQAHPRRTPPRLPFLTHKLILFRLLLVQAPSLSGPWPRLCTVFMPPCGALSTLQTGFRPPVPVCSMNNILCLEKIAILPRANFVQSMAPEHR